jgi:S-adenosyl-L-methionine hydrolase (adenosine-forming)
VARPLVALLTDFGTRDHYAGTMKGVVLGLCPEVTLIDITHEIAPHDVLGGALELAASYRYFPAGTIFVAVVDPGVGSSRRALVADVGDYRFVAPDNGVLTLVLQESRPKKVVELTERRYARPTLSRTFEGRDRFAPAAGWLARGVEPTAMGRPMSGWQTLSIPQPAVDPRHLRGEILRVDRFGNLVSNIDRKTFEQFRHDQTIHIAVGGHAVDRLVQTYAEADPGAVCALFGSSDHLEVAVNGDSAAERLGAGRGTSLRIDLGMAV